MTFDYWAFGIAPSSSYYAFYYSNDGEVYGLDGAIEEFEFIDNYYEYQQVDGDNYERVEKIMNNWYWGEAHF